jgi:hypothetical protein
MISLVLAPAVSSSAAEQPKTGGESIRRKLSNEINRRTEDLDGMIQRRVIRALVVPTRT